MRFFARVDEVGQETFATLHDALVFAFDYAAEMSVTVTVGIVGVSSPLIATRGEAA